MYLPLKDYFLSMKNCPIVLKKFLGGPNSFNVLKSVYGFVRCIFFTILCNGRHKAEQSVLGRILKNKEDIECKALQNESQSRKRKRRGKDNTVERALKEWFVKVRNKDARVSGSLLRQKTEELAEKMGKVDFKATEGWFHRALPKHTYVLQNDKAKGTKSCKKRITILCCASMTGEKKKLLVVGKSKQPRCFKGVNALPVDYTANKNAWMTQEIFCQWLIKWDNELDKKIVLLVDNCIAHNANDLSKKINILEALHFFNKAWNNISDVTIRNCFCHGGFVKTKEEEEEDDHSKNLADKTYEDWMDIDRDLQTSEEYSEDQICQSIINEITNNNDEENDESDEEVDIVVKPPSNKEFLEALDVIRRAVHHREIRQLLKLFFGLPLLSPEDFENCFYNDLIAIKPCCPKLDQFFDYVHDTYIMTAVSFHRKFGLDLTTILIGLQIIVENRSIQS
ncbi:hypothetical protein QTP88_013833 [Uroleucon formosanum]